MLYVKRNNKIVTQYRQLKENSMRARRKRHYMITKMCLHYLITLPNIGCIVCQQKMQSLQESLADIGLQLSEKEQEVMRWKPVADLQLESLQDQMDTTQVSVDQYLTLECLFQLQLEHQINTNR